MNAPVAKTCRQRCPFARFASICALVACALLLLPAVAGADGYSMTQTYISATVEADGSLTVVEGRQFDFDDDINGVFWEINTGTNQQGGTAGVDVLSVEEEDTAFNKVDSANKGDSGVYTVEQTGDGVRIKVFSPHESGDSAIYYVSYTMTGAVMNWADTAELYWKFVGDGWSADSDDVEMEVCFANAAAGTAAVKGDNFRAWGHGPLTGDVSLDEDEPMVTYTIPCVHQGEFAEARIAFPSDWVPQLAASGEDRMSTILSEEKEWADEANARREHARAVAGAIAVACVVVAVAYTGVIVMLKLRRPKPKPLFQDEYFRRCALRRPSRGACSSYELERRARSGIYRHTDEADRRPRDQARRSDRDQEEGSAPSRKRGADVSHHSDRRGLEGRQEGRHRSRRAQGLLRWR